MVSLVYTGMNCFAQNELFAVRWTGSEEVMCHWDFAADSLQHLDTFLGEQLQTIDDACYDIANKRVFVHNTQRGIRVFDAPTGMLLDSFPTHPGVYAIKYDPVAQKLVCLILYNPAGLLLATIDPLAKNLQIVDTLGEVTGYVSKPTFDPVGRRLIIASEFKVFVLDARNGNLLDTFPNPNADYFSRIEYDVISGKVLGVTFDKPPAYKVVFTELDLATGTYTRLAQLKGVIDPYDITAYDYNAQRYFIFTNRQVLMINSVTGAEMDSIPIPFSTSVMEYVNTSIPSGLRSFPEAGYTLYPNPAREAVLLEGLTEETTYSIFDMTGRQVSHGTWTLTSPRIPVAFLAPGFYRIHLDGEGTRAFIKE